MRGFGLCPECASALAGDAAAMIARDYPAIGALAAPSTSLLGLTSLVADRLGFPMVYVRSEAKVHGKQRQVEGQLRPDAAIGIINSDEIDVGQRDNIVAALAASGYSHVTWLPAIAGELIEQSRRCRHSATDWRLRAETAGPAATGGKRSVESPSVSDANSPFTEADERAIAIKIADALLKIRAVSVRPDAPFRYASGMLSPIYTDHRLLISHVSELRLVIDGFEAAIKRHQKLGFDALVGMSTSGIPHATLIGDRLGIPTFASDDLEAAAHFAGKRVAVIEDHITTGGSVFKAIESLRSIEVETAACFAIFTYGRDQARAKFRDEGVPLICLSQLDTLLDTAIGNRTVTNQDAEAVNDWLMDPAEWAARAEAKIAGASSTTS